MSHSETTTDLTLHEIYTPHDFPTWIDRTQLVHFLHESLKPYEDSTVDIDRARGRLQLGQESAGSLSRPRVVEIEAALNGCAPFMDFVMAQQGLTTFRFLFASGRR